MTTDDAGFVAKTVALGHKDLRIEARAGETFAPMLAFSIAVTLLLAFTLPEATTQPATVLAGFFWITVLFAGLIGFARTFEVEQQDGAIDALLLTPVDRSAIFIAKAATNLLYIVLVQVVLLPAFTILFSLQVGRGLAALVSVIALVDVGFVAIGTLFASLAAQTKSRELMLPILALPALVPPFIAGVELTSDLIAGASFGEVADAGWFVILVVYDMVFGIIGALAFEFVVE